MGHSLTKRAEARKKSRPPASGGLRLSNRYVRQAERMTSLFYTKYSTPEYSVVSVMTHTQTVSAHEI